MCFLPTGHDRSCRGIKNLQLSESNSTNNNNRSESLDEHRRSRGMKKSTRPALSGRQLHRGLVISCTCSTSCLELVQPQVGCPRNVVTSCCSGTSRTCRTSSSWLSTKAGDPTRCCKVEKTVGCVFACEVLQEDHVFLGPSGNALRRGQYADWSF